MRQGLIVFILFFSFAQALKGQDSTKVLTPENLYWYLVNFHPVSNQAAIKIEKGENESLKSRGQLDPVLFSNFNGKQFNDDVYYNLFSGGLKIPTWYNIDFNFGFDRNGGVNLNPEHKSTSNGLVHAGVTVPIGQGLLIDKRRATIKQANLYAESTFAEQQIMLNNLYFDATIAYMQWVNHYHQLQLFQSAFQLANERFIGVKQSFVGGDVPAIDTLEAYILVQVRNVSLNQARLNYKNATLELSNYLWFKNNTPLEISDSLVPQAIQQLAVPQTIGLDSLNALLMGLRISHPQLQWYEIKLKQLEIERRWNAEQLKPTLNFKYNFLNEPINGDVFTGFSTNDYTWGFDFKIPILLRESRGRLNNTNLSLKETNFEIDLKQLEIANKIKRYFNELVALGEQIEILNLATDNYRIMLEAEKQKFFMGESSVFLINTREAAYIQASIKLIELNVKYQSAHAAFKLASASW